MHKKHYVLNRSGFIFNCYFKKVQQSQPIQIFAVVSSSRERAVISTLITSSKQSWKSLMLTPAKSFARYLLHISWKCVKKHDDRGSLVNFDNIIEAGMEVLDYICQNVWQTFTGITRCLLWRLFLRILYCSIITIPRLWQL